MSNFTCSLARDITPHRMKNLPSIAFKWKITILLVLTVSPIHNLSLKVSKKVLFELGSERVNEDTVDLWTIKRAYYKLKRRSPFLEGLLLFPPDRKASPWSFVASLAFSFGGKLRRLHVQLSTCTQWISLGILGRWFSNCGPVDGDPGFSMFAAALGRR